MIIEGGRRSIVVRRGKCGKSRNVVVGEDLVQHVREFLTWKDSLGEPGEPSSPLFWSARSSGVYARRSLQKMFKTAARKAGLASHVSIHCTRHTYAVHLYKASGYNLRLVQKQLGHSSIRVTQIYADVFDADLVSAVDRLYGTAHEKPTRL